jgi:hypothetical protein
MGPFLGKDVFASLAQDDGALFYFRALFELRLPTAPSPGGRRLTLNDLLVEARAVRKLDGQ